MRLEGKVALVTGVGSGIGRAIALRYAAEGARLAMVEINPDSGADTATQVAERQPESLLIQADMARVAQIDAAVARTLERFGRIDVLVNNAGVTRKLDFFEVTEDLWDWMFAVNARGLFFCMQAVARVMREQQQGAIVNIASIAGKGFTGTSNIAYAGTKGAAIAMTRIGAAQLAPYNINVNSICPGMTMTGLVTEVIGKAAAAQGISEQALIDEMARTIPLKRVNTGDDIAGMAVFLASSDARNVTGQSYNVDGGLIWD